MPKRAIVTGASSGIGREVVRQLAQEGWQVLAVARRADRLAELAKEMPDRIVPHQADITANGASESIITAANAKLGGLDLLVNNAGIFWTATVADMPTDKLGQIIDLNLKAFMLMCRTAIPALEKSGNGQIINVSSGADRIPTETLSVYCASKAAVTMFTKILAKELGAKKIRVNLLAPCATDTEIFETAGIKVDPIYLVPSADIAKFVILLTKLPEGMDLGEVVPHKRYHPW